MRETFVLTHECSKLETTSTPVHVQGTEGLRLRYTQHLSFEEDECGLARGILVEAVFSRSCALKDSRGACFEGGPARTYLEIYGYARVQKGGFTFTFILLIDPFPRQREKLVVSISAESPKNVTVPPKKYNPVFDEVLLCMTSKKKILLNPKANYASTPKKEF